MVYIIINNNNNYIIIKKTATYNVSLLPFSTENRTSKMTNVHFPTFLLSYFPTFLLSRFSAVILRMK